MAEEDNSNAYSSSGSSGHDFCLLSEDDIAGAGDLATESQDASQKHSPHQSASSAAESSRLFGMSAPVDVEAIKQKAEVCFRYVNVRFLFCVTRLSCNSKYVYPGTRKIIAQSP